MPGSSSDFEIGSMSVSAVGRYARPGFLTLSERCKCLGCDADRSRHLVESGLSRWDPALCRSSWPTSVSSNRIASDAARRCSSIMVASSLMPFLDRALDTGPYSVSIGPNGHSA
jgi:hypothetical protein